MDREPKQGTDWGRDPARDFGDEPQPAWRTVPPDPLAPIDPNAPVSGHLPPRESAGPLSEMPEHDWGRAAALIYPTLHPVGTQGMATAEVAERLPVEGGKSHTQPILDDGPHGVVVAYSMVAQGFDILVNGDHLLSWGVGPTEVRDAAMRNLAAWSDTAPWTDEVSGDRRLLSSDSGDGWDAARILLPETRTHLARELGDGARVLIGLPERHLLLAGSLRPEDAEFPSLFRDFVVEQSGGADEPIDRRVFELVDGELVVFDDQ